MSKLYKIFFLFIVCILFVFNISIFFYNQEIMAYFKIDIEQEEPFLIKDKIDKEYSAASFNRNNLENPKFIKLRDFQVDLSDFDLPDHLKVDGDVFADPSDSSDDSSGDDSQELINDFPEFEVGNKNPFSPF